MRLKPYIIKPPAIKRIDIKIVEYDGKDYKKARAFQSMRLLWKRFTRRLWRW